MIRQISKEIHQHLNVIIQGNDFFWGNDDVNVLSFVHVW